MQFQPPGLTLPDAITRFVADRAARCAPATTRWYINMLTPLARKIGTSLLAQITTDDLRAYLTDQRQRANRTGALLSARTINGELRAAKILFNWAEEEGMLSSNPARKLKPIRTDRRRQPLTFDQVASILDRLRRGTWKMAPRDLVIFLFMYDTAARRAEVCRLRVEDLNLDEGWADLLGKGDKTRRVGLLPLTCRVLHAYIAERYRGPVFLNERKRPLQAAGLYQIFERLSARLRIPLYPHLIRHSSATHFILNAGDVGDLQILMGHSQIATTVGYVETARAVRALQAHREHSPVNRLREEYELPARVALRRVK